MGTAGSSPTAYFGFAHPVNQAALSAYVVLSRYSTLLFIGGAALGPVSLFVLLLLCFQSRRQRAPGQFAFHEMSGVVLTDAPPPQGAPQGAQQLVQQAGPGGLPVAVPVAVPIVKDQ